MASEKPAESGSPLITVLVRRITGASVGEIDVAGDRTVAALKEEIEAIGGPAAYDQQLVFGHEVLKDAQLLEALATDGMGPVMVFLVTVHGCPTCKGPCACSLCGCEPKPGLIDYYGVCEACNQCGGHASACPFCSQCFPSLCALDTHVRFCHGDREGDWHNPRFDEHLRKRFLPGAQTAAEPVGGTFMEARRGGLEPTRGLRRQLPWRFR